VTALSGLVPHGGGAIAILIASIWMAVIAAMIALEKRRNMAIWMLGAFIATFVLFSLANYALT
jgi:hypothetical protein